jgi:hypothetical protein
MEVSMNYYHFGLGIFLCLLVGIMLGELEDTAIQIKVSLIMVSFYFGCKYIGMGYAGL